MSDKTGPPDVADVKYVHRVSIGTLNPNVPTTEEQLKAQQDELNKCLTKGRIIGRDQNGAVFQLGEHQVTMVMTTYHVGFTRKPSWID